MSQHPSDSEPSTNPIKIAIWVVIGAVAMIVGVVLLAQYAVGGYTLGASNENAKALDATNARIAPFVQLAFDPTKGPVAPLAAVGASIPAAGSAPAVAVPIVAAMIPVAGASTAKASGGEGVYQTACSACHSAGVAGAPKSGDKAAWAPRIAQGKPTLYDHAIKGYQGKAGVMPAKGGNSSLSDADVKSAVDYMVVLNK